MVLKIVKKPYDLRPFKSSIFYIGVDGGGSKTHAILLNQNLDQLDEIYTGPANIATNVEEAYTSICASIDGLMAKHNLLLSEIKIGVGVAGYSVINKRNILITQLQKKYLNIILNSDCHIACLAAHNSNDGSVIICGTGVVGYSINNGRTKQLGGWGFPHGDVGGGAYLGLEICRLLCKAIDGLIPWNSALSALYQEFFAERACKIWLLNATPAEYAKIARFIYTNHADEFSHKLLMRGASEIAELIQAINRQNLPIKLVGGLASLYIVKLRETYPGLELSEIDPAFGAVLSLVK